MNDGRVDFFFFRRFRFNLENGCVPSDDTAAIAPSPAADAAAAAAAAASASMS